MRSHPTPHRCSTSASSISVTHARAHARLNSLGERGRLSANGVTCSGGACSGDLLGDAMRQRANGLTSSSSTSATSAPLAAAAAHALRWLAAHAASAALTPRP